MQEEGTHTDEIEPSEMLAIDASVVEMHKATVEYRHLQNARMDALAGQGRLKNAAKTK